MDDLRTELSDAKMEVDESHEITQSNSLNLVPEAQEKRCFVVTLPSGRKILVCPMG